VQAMQAKQQGRSRDLNQSDLVFEFMLNALRLQDGVNLTLFAEHTGLALEALDSNLSALSQQGLITLEGQHLLLTEKGSHFLNDVVASFLDET